MRTKKFPVTVDRVIAPCKAYILRLTSLQTGDMKIADTTPRTEPSQVVTNMIGEVRSSPIESGRADQ